MTATLNVDATLNSPLNAPQLLWDLQQVNQVAQGFSGCLVPEAIAQQVTIALVERFGLVFARLWLLEGDGTTLRLVASAGLYTHINGSFARVPMGAYKVGKIAQNRVPFLSNQLAAEPWVKDRDWAIANGIQGFAGYPLVAGDRTLGVLAAFSCQPLAAEFLEILQVLCMAATVALDGAVQSQASAASSLDSPITGSSIPGQGESPLSDQLTTRFRDTQFALVGTERPLAPAIVCGLWRMAEWLHHQHCNYCRLTYGATAVTLEAIAPLGGADREPDGSVSLGDLYPMATCLGGTLRVERQPQSAMAQVGLTLPYAQRGEQPQLSSREQEVMALLATGWRDRTIAQHLYISESTVKFHINNSLTKLGAKNRYEGVYKAALQGCI